MRWDDGAVGAFHPLWLRGECACPDCRSRVTLERTFDHFRLPLGSEATAVEVTGDGALRLVWSPAITSACSTPAGCGRGAGRMPRRWPGAVGRRAGRRAADLRARRDHDRRPRAARLAGGAARRRPRAAARRAGGPGEVERIARRISLPRDSNFGVVFDVITKPEANSNAYTTIELPGHVDLPTREYRRASSSSTAWRTRPPAANRLTSTASRWPSTCVARSRRASSCCARRRSAFASTTRSRTTPGGPR